MSKWILWICGFGIAFSFMVADRPVTLGPGIKAPDLPEQNSLASQTPFIHKGCELTPLATYSIKAKVLSRKKYRGAGSKVCPLDFALGWGKMSDEEILKSFDIRQSGRFFYWSASQLPIPKKEIVSSCANVHLIPASDSVESVLKSIKTGQVVYLEGQLVKVKSDDGWHAVSSLTRDDSGAGACEVLYVEIAFPSDL